MIWTDTNHSRDDPEEPPEAAMGELHEPSQMDVDFGPGPGPGTDRSDSDSEDEDWEPSDTDSDFSQTRSSDEEYMLDMDEMYGEGGSEDGCE